jgi:hypothetical protein
MWFINVSVHSTVRPKKFSRAAYGISFVIVVYNYFHLTVVSSCKICKPHLGKVQGK